jgi:rhamnogalacturonyl hydrolase YesR
MSVGYARNKNTWSFSSEVFYRSFSHILEYKDNSGYVTSVKNWEDAVTAGNGEAYGLELLLEKTT